MGRWFDATFPYLSESSMIDLHSLWKYVGRHAADKFSTAIPHRLSSGQSCGGTTSTECLLQQFAMVALQQPVDCDNLWIATTCGLQQPTDCDNLQKYLLLRSYGMNKKSVTSLLFILPSQ